MIDMYIAIIIAIITIAILLYLYYYGVLTPIRFHKKQRFFGNRQYLFFNHKMNYAESGKVWGEVGYAMCKHFKFSQMAGIYYDPPELVEDKQNCRLTFGIIVNPGEVKKIQQFQQEFPNYQLTTLPIVDAVYTDYPYRNPISFLFAVKKVYPNLHKYLMSSKTCIQAIMEIYDVELNKNIQFLAFYGDNAEQYVLHTGDAPRYKSQ